MTTMLDCLNPLTQTPAAIPTDYIVAAYLGHAGNPQSYQQAVDKFPLNRIVSIASHNAVDADILDIEGGAVDPGDKATILDWCARQRNRLINPTVYVNTSTWPQIRAYFNADTMPMWWAANWSHGPNLPPGSSGIQYGSIPQGADVSLMLDSWYGSIHVTMVDLTPAAIAAIGQEVWADYKNPTSNYPGAPMGQLLVDGRVVSDDILKTQQDGSQEVQLNDATTTVIAQKVAALITGQFTISGSGSFTPKETA